MTSFSSTVWHIQKYNVESQLSVILSWSYAHTHAFALCIFPQRSIYHKRKCVWIFNVAQGHRKTNVYDLPHARMRILLTEKCRCAEAYALQLHFGDTFFFVVSISFLSSSSLDFFTYFDFIIVVIVDDCVCVFFCFFAVSLSLKFGLMAHRSFSQEWILAFRLFDLLMSYIINLSWL